MAQKDFEAFTAELRKFAHLWQSGTLSCVAIGGQGLFINLGTRIVLNPEIERERSVLRFVDLTEFEPQLLGCVVKYTIAEINQLMYQLVGNGRFQLEINGVPCWVDASGRPNNQAGDITAPYPWLPPSSRVRSVAREEWNIDRPMRVLIQAGLPVHRVVASEQVEKLNTRLKGYKPTPFDGVVGLIRELMPGAPADPQQAFAQIAAPLPFDLSYDSQSGLAVVARDFAFENGIVISAFYKPSGSERQDLRLANSVPLEQGHFRRWQGDLKWPSGAQTANVALLYNDNEVDTLAGVTRPLGPLKVTGSTAHVQEMGGEGPMDSRTDWEQIGEPLGEGGQSRVLLVRRLARSRERTIAIRDIRETNPWHIATNEDAVTKAGQFAEAIWRYARRDDPTELGAMKIFDKLREAGPEGERQALERLKSEIIVLRQRRPGLPELLSANEAERWIVTEFFPEGTIEKQLDTYKGKPASALTAFRSLVKTVASLHDEKIVHRDIKPANVFIRKHSELVLGDFGIVYLPNQPGRQTQTNDRRKQTSAWVRATTCRPGPTETNVWKTSSRTLTCTC